MSVASSRSYPISGRGYVEDFECGPPLGGDAYTGLRALIRLISGICYTGGGTLLQSIIHAPWYLKLVIPAMGGLIDGPIVHFVASEA